MGRASAVAICVALVTLAPSAHAQPQVIERLRLQGGFIAEAQPAPTPRLEDLWIGAVPELVANWFTPRSLVSVSYSITGALHSLGGASEIANRLTLTSAHELTNRTNLLLSAEAAQTSVSNLLIQRGAGAGSVGLYPAAGTQFITGHVTEGLRHELSPNVQVSQELVGSLTTTLPPAPPLDTGTITLGTGIERLWRNDGVGMDLRGTYAVTRATAPTPSAEFFAVTAAPHWRRDWTPSLSSSLAAGGTYLTSPDPGTKPIVAPFAEASALWMTGPTSFDAAYSIGIFPSPLTGQILQSQQLIVHATTPISEHYRVLLGGSVGVFRGSIVDLLDATNDQTFDAGFSDVDITWQATNKVQVFGRYQFITQLGDVNIGGINSSFIRDAVIVGVQYSSEPVALRVPGRFAQRVDGADAPLRTDPGAAEATTITRRRGTPTPTQDGEPTPDDETSATGGTVEGMPGMWRTRPSPAADDPRNPTQPANPQRPGQPTRPNR